LSSIFVSSHATFLRFFKAQSSALAGTCFLYTHITEHGVCLSPNMSHTDPEKRSHEAPSSRSAASDADHTDAIHPVDPFATPGAQTPRLETPAASVPSTRPASINGGSVATSSNYIYYPRGEYFRSRRVKKGEVERPWLDKKDPREKWVTIIPLVGLFLGLCITGVLVWDGVRSVAVHKYCEVFSDDFKSLDSKVWTKEVELGGFGSVLEITLPLNF
jgi:hypothetical protein